MEFTDNQKKIFELINNEARPIDLEILIIKHFRNKNINVTRQGNIVEDLMINSSSADIEINISREVKDLLLVVVYVQENRLVYVDKYVNYGYKIKYNHDSIIKEYPELTKMLRPFWGTQLIPIFVLDDFINNGYKTKDELKYEEEKIFNERRLEEERNERKIEKKWRIGSFLLTIVATVSAIIIPPYIQSKMINKEVNTNIKKSDTVKIMFYNPTKDTGLKK